MAWCKDLCQSWSLHARLLADYPRRRSRSLIPKTNRSTPRGFSPRQQVGTSTQKKDQEAKEDGDVVSRSSEQTVLETKSATVNSTVSTQKNTDDLEEEIAGTKSGEGEVLSSNPTEISNRIDTDELEDDNIVEKEDEKIASTDNVVDEMGTKVSSQDNGIGLKVSPVEEDDSMSILSSETVKTEPLQETVFDVEDQTTNILGDMKGLKDINVDAEKIAESTEEEPMTGHIENVVDLSVEEDTVVEVKPEIGVDPEIEKQILNKTLDEEQVVEESSEEETITGRIENVVDLGVEEETVLEVKPEIEVDPEIQKQILSKIADENVSSGRKIFFYPQVVKVDQPCQIFLNRSISALVNEPDISIKGAFNDWKWKSFTEKLHKSDLQGDWWSCQIHVPKEAYRMDFVFFNGGSIYENNDFKDFHIEIEGEMNASGFEEFLVEEKRRELQKLAEEQAERERQAEEQRREEEERAGREADRAQARIEVEKRRQALYQLMRQAVSSVENLWHIEPNVFKEKDMIRIFYNRSSRPLAHATEIWIHGGYNKWRDGPSISERLSRSDKKDGDWWYADGMRYSE